MTIDRVLPIRFGAVLLLAVGDGVTALAPG